MQSESDRAFIEKIKTLTFNIKKTPTERYRPVIQRVESAAEVGEDGLIPAGYVTKNKEGRDLYIVHGDEDQRQVKEIIAEKQGDSKW